MEQQSNAPRPPRAWLKKEKRMVEVQSIHFADKEIEFDSIYDNKEKCWVWSNCASFADIILMQSTGEHDKNGVEIYAGDEIWGYLNESRLLTRGIVVWDDKLLMYGNKNQAGITPLHKISNIEVIGNDLENPELMGETK